jgi:RNA-directed DNA polymerase
MNTVERQNRPEPMYGWNDLPWREIEGRVFKLQKRIYRASRRGDVEAVHKLQRLLMNSWSAKCLAVRKVTQDNRGKRTAGVDGVASLTPRQRLKLAEGLALKGKARPVRRVRIPKPGSKNGETRPLGIPTMHDRALQALAKLALEPEWEARFEPNSYGFRPGRSCHDAVEAIFASIRYLPKYVLDADINKCFDRIDHQALLGKISTYPSLRRVIRTWLKAGIMDGANLFPTEEGTPQGGVLSPLLANIALHGLEQAVESAFPKVIYRNGGKIQSWRPRVVRYADDFVILHRDLEVIERAREIAQQWLRDMGLELKPSKTSVTHTLHPCGGKVGFDFLGFNIRQFPVGRSHRGTTGGRGQASLEFKTIIRPSTEAVKRHYKEMARVVNAHKAAPQGALIARLNPLVTGWRNYYSTVISKKVFSKLDHLVCRKLLRWAKRRHPHQSRRATVRKYWTPEQTPKWDFRAKDGTRLKPYVDAPIKRHTKVEGDRSPYDGDWVYWTTRLGKNPLISPRTATLLKIQ